MSTVSEFKVTLLAVMSDYQQAHTALSNALLSEMDYPIWLQSEPDDPRQALANLIMAWFYTDDDTEAGKTLQINGVVGVSPATFQLVQACNDHRQRLQKTLQSIDKTQGAPEEDDDDEVLLSRRFSSYALELMAQLGFPRLNRRQSTRLWVSVEGQLKTAGFFWNRYRKTIKLTRTQVIAKLDRITQYSTSDIAIINDDRGKLEKIDDELFVQVFPESIHQRVNLVSTIQGHDKKCQRYAHTPVFYVTQSHASLPILSPLPDHPADKMYRLPVSTVTIEEQPFLSSLVLHRLLPEYR